MRSRSRDWARRNVTAGSPVVEIASAISPDWHYVIVGLKREGPEVRSYRIVDGEIVSEPFAVV